MPAHLHPHAVTARVRNVIPAKSTAHRVACKALYRALLEQCPRIPLPTDLPSPGPINPLTYLIRKRFKRDVIISSPRLAVEALKVGYNAETLFQAAGDGSPAALSKIHALLRIQAQQSALSRSIPQPAIPRPPRPNVAPYPGAPKLLDSRPLPLEKLTGRRYLPFFTQTSGLSFLRFRKPQSPYLSRVLRDKIKQKQKRLDRMYELERAMEVGEAENEWEDIVGEQASREGIRMRLEGGNWMEESSRACEGISENIEHEARRQRGFGERLNEIWRQERGLLRREREEERRRKFRERVERRARGRKGGGGSPESKPAQAEQVKVWKPILAK